MTKEKTNPIKAEINKIGPVEAATIYSSDLDALKNAIEQARTSAYWHGYNEHRARVNEVEKKNLEDRIDDLEAKLENKEFLVVEAMQRADQEAGKVRAIKDLFDSERRELNKLQKNYDELRSTRDRMINEWRDEAYSLQEKYDDLEKTNRIIKGQLTRARNLLGEANKKARDGKA